MKKQSKVPIWIIIPSITAILAVGAVLLVLVVSGTFKKKVVEEPVIEETVTVIPDREPETPNYINETVYNGNLKQYMDLYEYPFKKSDSYIQNKDFYKDHSELFAEFEGDATQFMEALFNVDYRNIANNKTVFVTNVLKNADYMAYHTTGVDTEDEVTTNLYYYIGDIADYFIKNRVEMEAKFYTDDSLVYKDYYIFVRGELVFTIYSSDDTELKYPIGEECSIPMEVAIVRSNKNYENYVVSSFGEMTDDTFFYNP